MHDRELDRATDVFKAAGHPARLRILAMLRGGGLCVCQVTAVLELAVSTVSAHLAELRRAGLVLERKEGRWVVYGLAKDARTQALLREVWTRVGNDPQLEADGRLVPTIVVGVASVGLAIVRQFGALPAFQQWVSAWTQITG